MRRRGSVLDGTRHGRAGRVRGGDGAQAQRARRPWRYAEHEHAPGERANLPSKGASSTVPSNAPPAVETVPSWAAAVPATSLRLNQVSITSPSWPENGGSQQRHGLADVVPAANRWRTFTLRPRRTGGGVQLTTAQ